MGSPLESKVETVVERFLFELACNLVEIVGFLVLSCLGPIESESGHYLSVDGPYGIRLRQWLV